MYDLDGIRVATVAGKESRTFQQLKDEKPNGCQDKSKPAESERQIAPSHVVGFAAISGIFTGIIAYESPSDLEFSLVLQNLEIRKARHAPDKSSDVRDSTRWKGWRASIDEKLGENLGGLR